jgi:hypothetical protein
LRGVVNESERMDAGAFGRDDVGSVVARDRFGHLAADTIGHAHEKDFYRLGQGCRLGSVVRDAQKIFVDGRIAAQFWMECRS